MAGRLVDYLLASRILPQADVSCGRVPFFETVGESYESFAQLLAIHSAVWCVIWLACGLFAKACVCPFLPPSYDPKDGKLFTKENESFYVGQKLVMEIKCVLLCILANAALYDLRGHSYEVQFDGFALSEVAGVIFTTSEIADLILSGGFGYLDRTMVIHHLVHILLGLLIRGHCSPAYIAAVLMAQETSGIFLNYYLLMRNRAPKHWSVLASQALFALTFFIWRLGIGSYGTYFFLANAAQYQQPQFRSWQTGTLGASLLLASCLQWYWGRLIIKGLMKAMGSEGGKPKKASKGA